MHDLVGITNLTVGLEEARELEIQIYNEAMMCELIAEGKSFAEVREIMGWNVYDDLGPSHEKVMAAQRIVGKNLEKLICELIPILNL